MSIESAIQNKTLLQFRYDGYPRTVEPHIVGVNAQGQGILLAWQQGGGTESGAFVGWKLFHLDKIESLLETGTAFAGPRPDYKPDNPAFVAVSAAL
jgi:hypothetical protein